MKMMGPNGASIEKAADAIAVEFSILLLASSKRLRSAQEVKATHRRIKRCAINMMVTSCIEEKRNMRTFLKFHVPLIKDALNNALKKLASKGGTDATRTD